MLVVIANRYDRTARALVARWATHDTRLLTCMDLSVAGWRYYPNAPGKSTAVIDGRTVALAEINGVLICMPCVLEQELTYIIPSDRSYVATEMTAFLLAWLSELKCPILNRPTPTGLIAPNWRHEQWVYAAAQVGIPVHRVQRQITLVKGTVPKPLLSEQQPVTVTVIGDYCIGAVADELVGQARCLAATAGVELLAVQFSCSDSGAFFVSANSWPDISNDAVVDGILAHFKRVIYV